MYAPGVPMSKGNKGQDMNESEGVIKGLEEKIGDANQLRKKYGEPGSIMKASDGTLYEVRPDGSWRKIRG